MGYRWGQRQKKEQMLANGWRHFDSLAAMNAVADIENQPPGFQGMLVRSEYSWGDKDEVPK
jgi:hypothetical protein